MTVEKIKKMRNGKNISQTELANALFISRQTISKWEEKKDYTIQKIY
ncbi:MAG: helix-turn-helix transcriptional regulator [Bacteroidales bacterium]